MTSSRYIIARLAQAFGYFRRAQRLADAASESHLLREAETQLGAAIWRKAENIEALAVEYWNLRKLIKERDSIREKIDICQKRLDQVHEERADFLNNTVEGSQELLVERAKLFGELEILAKKRDQIVADARQVRRSYIGLKTKLEVLSNESLVSPTDNKDTSGIEAKLIGLRGQFAALKQERLKIAAEIEEQEAQVHLFDDRLKKKQQERRTLSSEAFQVMGDANQEISLLRAESGVIDTQMRQLYAEIGRYVSRNAGRDPDCTAASSSHHGLVDVMHALRRSITLNHRLADME